MIAAQVGLDAWNGGPRRTNGNLERLRNSEMPMDVHCLDSSSVIRQLGGSGLTSLTQLFQLIADTAEQPEVHPSTPR